MTKKLDPRSRKRTYPERRRPIGRPRGRVPGSKNTTVRSRLEEIKLMKELRSVKELVKGSGSGKPVKNLLGKLPLQEVMKWRTNQDTMLAAFIHATEVDYDYGGKFWEVRFPGRSKWCKVLSVREHRKDGKDGRGGKGGKVSGSDGQREEVESFIPTPEQVDDERDLTWREKHEIKREKRIARELASIEERGREISVIGGEIGGNENGSQRNLSKPPEGSKLKIHTVHLSPLEQERSFWPFQKVALNGLRILIWHFCGPVPLLPQIACYMPRVDWELAERSEWNNPECFQGWQMLSGKKHKLSQDKEDDIKNRIRTGRWNSFAELAREFGVHPVTIKKIIGRLVPEDGRGGGISVEELKMDLLQKEASGKYAQDELKKIRNKIERRVERKEQSGKVIRRESDSGRGREGKGTVSEQFPWVVKGSRQVEGKKKGKEKREETEEILEEVVTGDLDEVVARADPDPDQGIDLMELEGLMGEGVGLMPGGFGKGQRGSDEKVAGWDEDFGRRRWGGKK